MEKYEGVKFQCVREGHSFEYDARLQELNRWTYLLSELGLTPLHSLGASGNQSYRVDARMFIITKSGMIPEEELILENYCQIRKYDEKKKMVHILGNSKPSSESVLHNLIYQTYPEVHAVLHGHSRLLLDFAEILQLPVTEKYYDYGTVELARSVLEVLDHQNRFILLKDHGFIAVEKSIYEAGMLILDVYTRLLEVIKENNSLM